MNICRQKMLVLPNTRISITICGEVNLHTGRQDYNVKTYKGQSVPVKSNLWTSGGFSRNLRGSLEKSLKRRMAAILTQLVIIYPLIEIKKLAGLDQYLKGNVHSL